MSRIAYVNGRYVPHRTAAVHVEDRGYQFADGVYEVIAVSDGHLIDAGPHLDRLERSLRELRIAPPMARKPLEQVMHEVIRRNGVENGIIYIQMTRGVAPRDHAFPAHPKTQVVMTARRARPQPAKIAEEGVKAITLPDIRWKRCDIKSVSLLPNILAKQQAKEAGAYEAWLVDANGLVTEGSSTNAWIVTRDGQLVTRSIENAILAGITRGAVLALAREEGLSLVERPFSVSEAKAAREAFVTSTSSYVTPVTQIDDQVIANGRPGSISLKLRARYMSYMAGEPVNGRRARD
ncbi:MAG TPA: D-amino-acid transaminase [Alphaproteobacteria bacterium]|nr:D-amino-acid transaminase [Alphaproteobacteria bacterium]